MVTLSANPKYGEIFHKIRKDKHLTLEDFKSVIPKTSLSHFENGTATLSIEKLLALLKMADIQVLTYFSMTGDIPFNKMYGEKFQMLREQREYQREDFRNFPSLCLQYFEEGQSTLTFDQLDAMLSEMNLIPKDFANLIYDGEEDYFIEIFHTIELAYHKCDTGLLKEIYEEKRQSEYQDYRIIAFSANALYAPLDKSEVEQASGFLMAVEHWTTFELSAFACLAGSIDLNLLRSILRDFIKTNDLIINDHSYRKRVVQAGTRVIFAFLDKKDFNSAKTTLAYIKNYIRYTDNYSKIVYKFAYGAYLYAIGEDEQGNVMKDVIQVCETIENPLLKKRLSKTFSSFYKK